MIAKKYWMGIDDAKQAEIEKAKAEKIERDDKLFFEQIQKPIPEAGFHANHMRLLYR